LGVDVGSFRKERVCIVKEWRTASGWVTEQGIVIAFNSERKTGLSGIWEYRLIVTLAIVPSETRKVKTFCKEISSKAISR
jgi:hypothetical protein